MRFLNSVRALYAAAGILSLTSVAGVYVDARSESMHLQRLEVSTGLEKMTRLSESLNSMLLVAALDQNLLRTSSYDTVSNDLAQTMETVVALTTALGSATEVSALTEGRTRSRVFEENTIDSMRSEKWAEARDIVFGDAYVLARKTNEIDIETAVGAVEAELSSAADAYGRVRATMTALRLAALVLLVWVGIAFSRRSRADLAEQIRLREEIALARDGLEERVEARTRELARENEVRRKSEMRTHLILQSAGEGIFGVDRDERIAFLNDAAEKLLGYAHDELIGTPVHETIHHSYADGTPYPREGSAVHQACTRGVSTQAGDKVFWRKDGTCFQIEHLVTPIFADQGAVDGAVIVFRDVTEQRKAAEEQKRRVEELERFNRLTVSREERMIELKKEINDAAEALGREKKYKIVE